MDKELEKLQQLKIQNLTLILAPLLLTPMTVVSVGASASDFHLGINTEGYMETAKGSFTISLYH